MAYVLIIYRYNFIFGVLKRWLLQKKETGASFIYTINTYQAVKVLIQVRVRVPVGDRVCIQVMFRCRVGNGVRTWFRHSHGSARVL